MSIPRLVGVGVGLLIGAGALVYLWISLGFYLHEPGVENRGAKCTLASLPFLITVMIVFLSFYSPGTSFLRAVVYTILAELLMCSTLWLFAWGLARSWKAQSPYKALQPLTLPSRSACIPRSPALAHRPQSRLTQQPRPAQFLRQRPLP